MRRIFLIFANVLIWLSISYAAPWPFNNSFLSKLNGENLWKTSEYKSCVKLPAFGQGNKILVNGTLASKDTIRREILWNGTFLFGSDLFDFTSQSILTHLNYFDEPVSSTGFIGTKFCALSRRKMYVVSIYDFNGVNVDLRTEGDTVSEPPVLLKLKSADFSQSFIVPVVISHDSLMVYSLSQMQLDHLVNDTAISAKVTKINVANTLTAFYPQRNRQPDIRKAYLVYVDNGALNIMQLTIAGNNLSTNTTQWNIINGTPRTSAFSVDSPYVYALATDNKLTLYRFELNNQLNIHGIEVGTSLDIDSINAMEFAPGGRYLYFSRGDILYALDIRTNELDTVWEAQGEIKNLQITPLGDLAVVYDAGFLTFLSNITHPHFLATEDLSFFDINNEFNYPSGWFPLVFLEHEPDTIKLMEPVTFSVTSRFENSSFGAVLWNNLGDSIQANALTFDVSLPRLKVGFKANFTGKIDVFAGNDSTHIEALFPYKVYIEWPKWRPDIFWLEPKTEPLAIPDYQYDSVRWFYNFEHLADYDDETELDAEKPGVYEVEAYFKGGIYKDNRTFIHYLPESIFDSLDIHYEVKLENGQSYQLEGAMGEDDIQAYGNHGAEINCVVNDSNNVLRNGRQLEFYYLIGDSLISDRQVSFKFKDNGNFLVLGIIKYLDRYAFRAIIFKTDSMLLDYGEGLTIRYLKPLKLIFSKERLGFNEDSSQFYVLANLGSPNNVSVFEYSSPGAYKLKDFSHIYYKSLPVSINEPIRVSVNGNEDMYYYQPQSPGDDSSYIVFDGPVIFSLKAQQTLQDYLETADVDDGMYMTEDGVIQGKFYHVPFGVYRPQSAPDGNLYVYSLSPEDISSFDFSDKLSIFIAKSDTQQVIDLELYDKNSSLFVKQLNDTVFELKTFRIVTSKRGNLLVVVGMGDQPFSKLIPYRIIGIEKVKNFGGNFILTPNNDGVNDYLNILDMINFWNLNASPDFKVSIINSKGEVIAKLRKDQLTGFDQWQGKINGRQLPSGVYWFIISDNKNVYSFTVTILR